MEGPEFNPWLLGCILLFWGRHWVVRLYVVRVIEHVQLHHPRTAEFIRLPQARWLNPYLPRIAHLIDTGSASADGDDASLDRLCADARNARKLAKAMAWGAGALLVVAIYTQSS